MCFLKQLTHSIEEAHNLALSRSWCADKLVDKAAVGCKRSHDGAPEECSSPALSRYVLGAACYACATTGPHGVPKSHGHRRRGERATARNRTTTKKRNEARLGPRSSPAPSEDLAPKSRGAAAAEER